MISIDPRGLAGQLGLWDGTNWMLTAFPAWMLLVVPFLLSIGLFLVVRTCVEFSAPNLHKQYKGLWPGDAFLAASLGLLMVGMAFYASPVVSPFWRSPLWNAATLVVVILVVGVLAAFEYIAAFKARKSPYARPSHAYTLYQLHTPTALAHRFTMFVFAYLFMKVGVVAFATSAVPVTLKMAALVLLTSWATCVLIDNATTRPDLSYVYLTSGAWFGIGRRRPASVRPTPREAAPSFLSAGVSDPAPTGAYRYAGDEDTDGRGWATGGFGDTRVDEVPAYRADNAPAYGGAGVRRSAISFGDDTPPPPPAARPRRLSDEGSLDRTRPVEWPSAGREEAGLPGFTVPGAAAPAQPRRRATRDDEGLPPFKSV